MPDSKAEGKLVYVLVGSTLILEKLIKLSTLVISRDSFQPVS
jgi:hypothetical protein